MGHLITKSQSLTRTQDVDGKEYIDFIGMFSVVNTGHCHPDIQKAMAEQLKKSITRDSQIRSDHLANFKCCQSNTDKSVSS